MLIQRPVRQGKIRNFSPYRVMIKQAMVIMMGLLLVASQTIAQKPAKDLLLKVDHVERTSAPLGKRYAVKEEHKTVASINEALTALIRRLQVNGYVSASIDTVLVEDNVHTAKLFVGEQYIFRDLNLNSEEEFILGEAGIKDRSVEDDEFNFRRMDRLLENVLRHLENNGYPFAQVWLDSFQVDGNEFSAGIAIEKGTLITFDTLTIIGEDIRVAKGFLYSYLDIRPGKPYNEDAVVKIRKRISDLVFLSESDPLQVLFADDKAKITLYLTDKKASQFDFLVGFLPNSQSTGKLLITGEANLDLTSALGRGEEFELKWQKLQARTQDLDVHVKYPYLLNLPLALDGRLDLYKRDTFFLDLGYEFGLQYLFSGANYVGLFVNNKATNVLNVDTNTVKATRALPINNDIRNTLIGLEFYQEKLDYRINPRKGYVLRLRVGGGLKRIRENNQIVNLADPENPGETFQSLYDSVDTRSVQFQFHYQIDKFWPIGRRSTLKTGVVGAALLTDNIFVNELYRIGGVNLLRGFDEENIFTSLYSVATVEYRFLLSANSYFNIFFDAAYVEDRSGGQYSNDFPYGFGAGLSFETKAGLFGVTYAIGSQQGNPVDFRAAKIHFGYVNYF